jgi:hypothetical protein
LYEADSQAIHLEKVCEPPQQSFGDADDIFLPQQAHGGFIPGSSVGASQIRGTISALENMHANTAYNYKDISEAQVNLHSDDSIHAFKLAAKHHKLQRLTRPMVSRQPAVWLASSLSLFSLFRWAPL